MLCRAGNQVIHAFPTQRTEEAFADRIRLRALWRSFQYCKSQVPDVAIEVLGENTIPIMDEEAVGVIGRDGFAELLQCP